MEEGRVIIPLSVYNGLLATVSQVAVIERMLNDGIYITDNDLRAILNIENKEVKDV